MHAATSKHLSQESAIEVRIPRSRFIERGSIYVISKTTRRNGTLVQEVSWLLGRRGVAGSKRLCLPSRYRNNKRRPKSSLSPKKRLRCEHSSLWIFADIASKRNLTKTSLQFYLVSGFPTAQEKWSCVVNIQTWVH